MTTTICWQCREARTGTEMPEPLCLDLTDGQAGVGVRDTIAGAAENPASQVVLQYVPDTQGRAHVQRYTAQVAGAPVVTEHIEQATWVLPGLWDNRHCRLTPDSEWQFPDLRAAYLLVADSPSIFGWEYWGSQFSQAHTRFAYQSDYLRQHAIRLRLHGEMVEWLATGGAACFAADPRPTAQRLEPPVKALPCKAYEVIPAEFRELFFAAIQSVAPGCVPPGTRFTVRLCREESATALATYDQAENTVSLYHNFFTNPLYLRATPTERSLMMGATLSHEICGHLRHTVQSGIDEAYVWYVAATYGLPFLISAELQELAVAWQLPMGCRRAFSQWLHQEYDLPTNLHGHPHHYGEVIAILEEMNWVEPRLRRCDPQSPDPALRDPACRPTHGPYVLGPALIEFFNDSQAYYDEIRDTLVEYLTIFPEAAGELEVLYRLLYDDPHLSPKMRSLGLTWVTEMADDLRRAVPRVARSWSGEARECQRWDPTKDPPPPLVRADGSVVPVVVRGAEPGRFQDGDCYLNEFVDRMIKAAATVPVQK